MNAGSSTVRHRGRPFGLAPVSPHPPPRSTAMSTAIRCPTCDETVEDGEPCHCQRDALRRVPPPLAHRPAAACADSQHYACSGYVGPQRRQWQRCSCSCHDFAAEGAGESVRTSLDPSAA